MSLHKYTHSLQINNEGTAGKRFLTASLGGMSGAQPKAGNIAGVVSVTAEVNPAATYKRHEQGWVDEVYNDLNKLCKRTKEAIEHKEVVSLAYDGNAPCRAKRVIGLAKYALRLQKYNPLLAGQMPEMEICH